MRVSIFWFAVMLWCAAATAQQQRHERVSIVPISRAVTIDGDLSEWDLSGSIECIFDEALRPKFTVRIAFMYDADALYIGAHFLDNTPLLNRHDPKVEPNKGWAGDCLQVRLCSDPTAPYPLRNSNSDRICHLTMWYFSDQQLPVLQIQYGMDYHGTKVLVGKESNIAFQKDSDGKGYTLEACIRWERLNAKNNPPKANEQIALVVQPLWSDSTGWRQTLSFNDVIRQVGFSFQNTSMWGQAILSPRGHLSSIERPRTATEELQPLTLTIDLPDPKAKSLSLAVYNVQGELVRTLPVITLTPSAESKSVKIRWNGLDDDGRPLPPGHYTVKTLSHRGIKQKWVTSLHNAGNPPWRTDDGTGSWGGDHGPPIAAASDSERVYLGWTISEAGWSIIAVETHFTSNGKVRKLWGQHQVLEIGIYVTDMASDGKRLFVAQDGKRWGQKNADSFKAGVVLWESKTGKPLNFPFGKRVLLVSEWPATLKQQEKPLWEKVAEGDIGPQDVGLNLLGIAVSGDTLYASLHLENKIVAFNWRTGEKLRDYPLPKPAGITVDEQGDIIAISGKRVVQLDPQLGKIKPIVSNGLSSPWGITLDKENKLYVTDCGKAMQVKVFTPEGQLIGTIGNAGGRPWVGHYDPLGMLKPAGITVDSEGKVWVAEYDQTPKRVSVWSRDGKLLVDLLGGGAYAVEGIADEQRPEWVNVHNTLFEVDYNRGKARTVATLIRPNLHGLQIGLDGGFMGRALKFRHIRGQIYVVHTGRGAVVIHRLRDDLIAEPIAAMGDTGHLRFHLPSSVLNKLDIRGVSSFWWVDRNNDTLLQLDEMVIEGVPSAVRNYWGPWVDDDLTFWGTRGNGVWRVAVKEWLPNGTPIYPKPSEQKMLFEVRGNRVLHAMPDGESVYVLEQQGGSTQTGQGAKWSAISRYTLDGKRLWAYRRVWLGFGLEAPLSKPGDVVGAMKFIGKVALDSGVRLIAVNGYFGQFNVLSDDGLWVTSLCKDNRYGPPADNTTIWPENFSGFFFRNRENGKVYLIAGDTDARIWEITGLKTIRIGRAELDLTKEDRREALRVAMRRQGVTTGLAPIRLRQSPALRIDGRLNDWDMNTAVTIDAGAKRSAKVALAYDETRLFIAFDVRDDSPMRNSGRDFALLFKTGDVCDLMLATDPNADPKRTRPARGDIRLLFSEMEGQPVCVLYEPLMHGGKRRARMFSSPTGAESFDRVLLLKQAQVIIKRKVDGYILEASVPLASLGFSPTQGLVTKGDLGVIFSDPGGNRDVLRAYHANKDTAIVNDIPSEVRLEPHKWGIVQVE